jgi:hypothetical protein
MFVPIKYNHVEREHEYDEYFSWYQLFGVIILLIGVIVYNELIEVPYWGFNLNTKRAIARR